MNKKEIDKGIVPSSKEDEKKITFSIEKKTLVQVIILLLSALFVVGCINEDSVKKVHCIDNGQTAQGWVSAEANGHLWVVDKHGKVVEFSKRDCSIDN